MGENCQNFRKETYIKVQKAQRFPNKMTPKRPTARHIIIKMAKVKDKKKNLKVARDKESHTKKLLSGYQLISLQKLCRPEGVACYI